MAKRAPPAERDERRRKVAILLIAGATTNSIAATVGVNRKTVLLDAKAVRAEWARARVEAYARYAAEQLVILAEVQRANWEATMRGDTILSRFSALLLLPCLGPYALPVSSGAAYGSNPSFVQSSSINSNIRFKSLASNVSR